MVFARRADPEGQLRDLDRRRRNIHAEQVIVQDEIVWAGQERNICWNLLTDAEISLNRRSATLKKSGKSLRAKIISPAQAVFRRSAAQQNPPEMLNEGFRLLTINFAAKEPATTICVVLANNSADFVATPLAEWQAEALTF